MAINDHKIAAAEYTGKDIAGLADVPALTAAQLKARFDSLIKDLVAVKYNALIDELVTLVDTLATKDADGTEDNFASLDADGNIQDSGSNAADFEAAGTAATAAAAAVSTHNSAASPHTGKFATATHTHGNVSNAGAIGTAADLPVFTTTSGALTTNTAAVAMGKLTEKKSGTFVGSAGVVYTKIADVVCGSAEQASGLIMIQDGNYTGNYGLLEVACLGSGSAVAVGQFSWISRYGFDAYIIPYNATTSMIYLKVPSIWEVPVISFLGQHNGTINLYGSQSLEVALPSTPDATATDYHKLGDIADLPVFTTTSGVLATKSAVDALSAIGAAAASHTHTRSSLGFLSYKGEVSVAGSVNYVDVTISGMTSSYRAFAFRAGVTGTTGNAVPVGAVCSTNNCRVYFSSNGEFSTTISIFATL